MGAVEFLITLITFSVTLVISLGILVPFIGIVVRYRANYNPRALNLGEEEARVAPRISSLFAMFLRTRRIEGWQGLWKGFSAYFVIPQLRSQLIIEISTVCFLCSAFTSVLGLQYHSRHYVAWSLWK